MPQECCAALACASLAPCNAFAWGIHACTAQFALEHWHQEKFRTLYESTNSPRLFDNCRSRNGLAIFNRDRYDPEELITEEGTLAPGHVNNYTIKQQVGGGCFATSTVINCTCRYVWVANSSHDRRCTASFVGTRRHLFVQFLRWPSATADANLQIRA